MELLACELRAPLSTRVTNNGRVHTGVYYAETDTPTTGDHVLAICQQLEPGLPSFPTGGHRIPDFGVVLTTDKGIPEYQARNAAWVAADEDRYGDFSSYFDMADPQGQGDFLNTRFLIRCTWQQPQQAGSVANAGFSQKNYNVSPLSWATEYWTEQSSKVSQEQRGRLITAGEPGTENTMVNYFGDPLPPLEVAEETTVLVAERHTQDPFAAIKTTQAFQRTTNNASWTVQWDESGTIYSLTAAKHSARFLKSTLSRRKYWKNVPYYTQQTRVEFSDEPYYERRLNEGYRVNRNYTLPVGTATLLVSVDENGIPYSSPIPLKSDGFAAANVTEHVYYDYLVLREANYDNL